MKTPRKKILYGFQGDGRGHLSRAEVLIPELAKYCDVTVLTTRTGASKLSQKVKRLSGVEISGNIGSPRLYFRENRIRVGKTMAAGVAGFLRKGLPNIARSLRAYRRRRPDLIISDLEPHSAWLALFTGTPFVSFDHQHIVTDCEIEFPPEYRRDRSLARYMIYLFVPKTSRNLITTFYFPPVRKGLTRLFKPLLRPEIIASRPAVTAEDFVLVYQTTPTTFPLLDRTLKGVGGENFVVYNMDREYRDGTVTYREVSGEGFIRDLASCKAVICNGGFTLISEALFLGKPVLAIPISNSFEQILNSYYLDKLGYGRYVRDWTVGAVRRFLAELDGFGAKVRGEDFYGNREIFRSIRELV